MVLVAIEGDLCGGCAPPPRAYPARCAPLARAPFAVRKGCWWCLMACCGERVCCWFGWCGPGPPRASPARIAALARAPLRCAKGAWTYRIDSRAAGLVVPIAPRAESHIDGDYLAVSQHFDDDLVAGRGVEHDVAPQIVEVVDLNVVDPDDYVAVAIEI